MTCTTKSSHLRRSKVVDCEECQSSFTVQTVWDSYDRLHTVDCPLRWNQPESLMYGQICQNHSDFEEILSVVEIYPAPQSVSDDFGQPTNSTTVGASPSEIVDDYSLSLSDVIEDSMLSNTVMAKHGHEEQQTVPNEDTVSADGNTAVEFTLKRDGSLNLNMLRSASSSTGNPNRKFASSEKEAIPINYVSAHICMPALSVRSPSPANEKQTMTDGPDQGELKCLHEPPQQEECQALEEDAEGRNESGTNTFENKENAQSRNQRRPRNDDGDDTDDDRAPSDKDEDNKFESLVEDRENLSNLSSSMTYRGDVLKNADICQKSGIRIKGADAANDSILNGKGQ